MKKPRQIRFEPPSLADIEYIAMNMREADAEEVFNWLPHDNPFLLARSAADYFKMGQWGMCVYWDDRPVAVLGLVQHRPGVFEGWCFGTSDFRHIAKPLTKFLKYEISQVLRDAGAHRVYAVSRSTHVEAHKWLHLLGLTYEGTERRAGKDRVDYLVYAATA